MKDRPVMTDDEMIKDYPRLKLEYTRLHEDFRRLQSKQLIIGDVRRSALEWWNQLKGNRQGIMTKHRGIIYNAKTRQPMELTGSEIEMLFKIEGHYA